MGEASVVRAGGRGAGAPGRLAVREVPRVVRFAFALAWEADRRGLLVVLGCTVLGTVLAGAGLVALRSVLAGAWHPGGFGALVVPVLVLGAVAVLNTLLESVGGPARQTLTLRVGQAAMARVLRVASAVPLRRYEDPGFHDRVSRVVAASLNQPFILVSGLAQLVSVSGGVVLAAGALLAMQWWLLPLVPLAAWPAVRAARRNNAEQYALSWELAEQRRHRRYLEGLLTGRQEAKEVRAFQLAEPLLERWRDSCEGEFRRTVVVARRSAVRRVRAALASQALAAAVLALVGLAVWRGVLSLASAGTVVAALRMLDGRLRAGGMQLASAGQSVRYLEDLRDFVAPAEERPPVPPAPAARFAELRLEKVTFRYPRAGRDALREVSVRVRAGEVVALVGRNGSGKTTLAKVICGLYEPDGGTVLWDGRPVGDPGRLRVASAVLFQDFVRYWLSAADNIGLGRIGPAAVGVVRERLDQAARDAGADGFLRALPSGYDTVLAKEFADGADLSGGQWQRVALARAFYRDAGLVVLDEPTAALDPEAEAELFDRARQLFRGRTVVLISHRLAGVRDADRIYVLHEGEVVEEGCHDALIALGGRYARMFTVQAAGYTGRGSG